MNGLNAICKKNVILNVPGKPKSEMKYLDGKLFIDYHSYNYYFMKWSDAVLKESKANRIQLELERENLQLKNTIEALQSRLTGRVKSLDPHCKMRIVKGGAL